MYLYTPEYRTKARQLTGKENLCLSLRDERGREKEDIDRLTNDVHDKIL